MSRSLDLEKLNVEDQLAVGWDAGDALAAVGEVGRNRQTTLAADGHASNADIPALDNLALTQLEGERWALLVRYFPIVSV